MRALFHSALSLLFLLGCGGGGGVVTAPPSPGPGAAAATSAAPLAPGASAAAVAAPVCTGGGAPPFDLRSTFAVARAEGDVVVAGNWGGTTEVARLDTTCSTWSRLPAMTARRSLNGSMIQLRSGDLLVAGGAARGGPWAERFSKKEGVWSVSQRDELDGWQGKLLALADGGALWVGKDVFWFDGESGAWKAIARDTLNQSALLLDDGNVLIAGAGKPSLIFEASKRSLASVAALPFVAERPALVGLGVGRVLAAGGLGPKGPVREAATFEVRTHTWTPVAPMPRPRADHALLALASGEAAVTGNGVGEEVFSPSTGLWESRRGPSLSDIEALPLPDGRHLVFTGGMLVRERDGTYRAGTGSAPAIAVHVLPSGAVRAIGGLGILLPRADGTMEVVSSPGDVADAVPLDEHVWIVRPGSDRLARFDSRTGAVAPAALPKGIAELLWIEPAEPGVVLAIGALSGSERERIVWIEPTSISLGETIADFGSLLGLGNGRVLILPRDARSRGDLRIIRAREKGPSPIKGTLPPKTMVRSACRVGVGRVALVTGPLDHLDAVDRLWLYDDETESISLVGELPATSQDAACASVAPGTILLVFARGQPLRVDLAKKTMTAVELSLPGFRPYSAISPSWRTIAVSGSRLLVVDDKRGLLSVLLPP